VHRLTCSNATFAGLPELPLEVLDASNNQLPSVLSGWNDTTPLALALKTLRLSGCGLIGSLPPGARCHHNRTATTTPACAVYQQSPATSPHTLDPLIFKFRAH
jgi:hypothetical protein